VDAEIELVKREAAAYHKERVGEAMSRAMVRVLTTITGLPPHPARRHPDTTHPHHPVSRVQHVSHVVTKLQSWWRKAAKKRAEEAAAAAKAKKKAAKDKKKK